MTHPSDLPDAQAAGKPAGTPETPPAAEALPADAPLLARVETVPEPVRLPVQPHAPELGAVWERAPPKKNTRKGAPMKGPPKNITTRSPKPSKLLRLIIEHRLRLARHDMERASESEAPLVKHRFR